MTDGAGNVVMDQDYMNFGGDLPKIGQLETQNEVDERYKYTHEIPYIDTLYRYIISEDKYVEIKLEKAYHLYSAAWSPAERIIAAGIYDPELKKDTLALIDPENGKVTQLTTLDHKLYLELDWSPDGRNIIYTAYDISFYGFRGTWPWSNDNTDVYVYDIENDEIRNITNSEGTDYNPQWIP